MELINKCKDSEDGNHFTVTANIEGEIRKVCLFCGERIE